MRRRVPELPALADDSGLCVECAERRTRRAVGALCGRRRERSEQQRRTAAATVRRHAAAARTTRACSSPSVRPKMQSRSSSMRAGTAKLRKRRVARAASATTRCSIVPILALTAAELDPAHKNRISHRGLALACAWRRGWPIGIDEFDDRDQAGAACSSRAPMCPPICGRAASTCRSLPPLALYVHYPWCVRKCPYCDFNSHEASALGAPEDEYLNAAARRP